VEAIISSENLSLSKLHGTITQKLISVEETKYLSAIRRNLLSPYSALKMEVVGSFETLLKIRQTTVTSEKTVISNGTMK
jgi:hypothetical protein